MSNYNYTKVFEINDMIVVADTIEEAIYTYKFYAPNSDLVNISTINSCALKANPPKCSCQAWDLTHITFTGVDEWTDIDRLVDIQRRYPKAEFGVLFSNNWRNNGNRYPSPEFIRKLRDRGLRLSCHLCGSLAREIMQWGGGMASVTELGSLLDIFQRIQLNVAGFKGESLYNIKPGDAQEIIIQQGDNLSLFEQCYIISGEHIAVLLDRSGGRGIDTPIDFPPYAFRVHVGFAGGINPDNVIGKVKNITTSSLVGKFWIDMESGVRTDDRFDLDKVEDVCKKVYDEFLTERG